MYIKQSFKNLIRKIINTIGFEISRKGYLRISLNEVLDHILNLGFNPQTVIDVGAANGTFELYQKFPDSKHILIEPVKEYEGALKRISCKYNAEYILAAAGAKPGKVIINIHPDLFGSSVYKEQEGSYADGLHREVELVTIDDLCKERDLMPPYLLKADVQGAELEVIDGANEILKYTEVIILEVSLFQFLINGPQFYDVVSYMKDHNFSAYDIFGGNYRPLDNALAQVDMLFVKANGQFRKQHFYATKSQREKMKKNAPF